MGSGTLRVRVLDPAQRAEAGAVLAGALGVDVRHEPDPATLSAQPPDTDRVPLALAELSRAGIAVAELALGQPTLDEVFLALTGRPADADPEPDAASGSESATDTKTEEEAVA